MSMKERLTRRQCLQLGAITAVGAVAGCAPGRRFAALGTPGRPGRSLRVAHLTDSHTQPERRGGEGTIACLRHVQRLDPPADLVVTGGDLIMDAFEADRVRTKLQWDLFTGIFRDECGVPVVHTLGNHDIWGWARSKSGATGSEPEYGKKWAVDTLGLERPYQSFDRGGWHFVILDSVAQNGEGYLGKLDEPQMEWLLRDLAAVPRTTPIVVVSHIPILAACVLSDPESRAESAREFKVSGGLMMLDSRRIREGFRAHPNVRLCLSGHIHQLDRVDFEGVTYICDGAVSGAWWRGANQRCHEGYGVIDLHADGTWSHTYMSYGWKAAEA